jgi:hypothetical protein
VIHGLIGDLDEIPGVMSVAAHGDAYAGIDGHTRIFNPDRLFDAVEYAARNVEDHVTAHIFDEHDEFISCKPADVVSGAYMRLDSRSHLLEKGITRVVSVTVVYLVVFVQID